MTYRVLGTVVLARDLDAHGLRRADLGTVVELYEPDGLEVEFVTASWQDGGAAHSERPRCPPCSRRRSGLRQNMPSLGLRSTDNNAFHLPAGLAFARPPAGECARWAVS